MKCILIFDKSAIDQDNVEIVAPTKKDARVIIENEIMSTYGPWNVATTDWVFLD